MSVLADHQVARPAAGKIIDINDEADTISMAASHIFTPLPEGHELERVKRPTSPSKPNTSNSSTEHATGEGSKVVATRPGDRAAIQTETKLADAEQDLEARYACDRKVKTANRKAKQRRRLHQVLALSPEVLASLVFMDLLIFEPKRAWVVWERIAAEEGSR